MRYYSYRFNGWKDEKGNAYADEQQIKLTSDLKLSAQWIKQYEIKFNSNTGSGTMDSLFTDEKSNVTLIDNAFTKPGFEFTGWSDSETGDIYENKAVIQTVKKDYVLYAQWKAIKDEIDNSKIYFSYVDPYSDYVSDNAKKWDKDHKNETVMFTIDLVDENGNSILFGEKGAHIVDNNKKNELIKNAENLVGRTFELSSPCLMSKDTFGAISIPGYSISDNYYFFWEGNFQGNKRNAYKFKNFGKKADNGGAQYESFIGFLAEGDIGKDYKEYAGYYAYNPTGVLRIVFKKVSNSNPYKIYYWSNGRTVSYNGVNNWNASWHDSAYYPIDKRNQLTEKYLKDNGYAPGEDYRLDGWYTDNTFKTKVSDNVFNNSIDSDVNFYAKWEKQTANYSMECYVQNLENDNYAKIGETVNASGSIGATVSFDDSKFNLEAYDGIIEENTTNSNRLLTSTIAADGSTVLKKYYDRKLFSVSVSGDDGITEGSFSGAGSYKAGASVAVNASVKTGYSFSKWTQVAGGNSADKSTDLAYGFTMPKESISLKANTSKNKYTVTYILNGGTSSNENFDAKSGKVVFSNIEYGSKVPTIDNPTKTVSGKYVGFVNWKEGTAALVGSEEGKTKAQIASFTVSSDIYYYAQWSEASLSITPYSGVYDGLPHGVNVTSEGLTNIEYSVDNSTWSADPITYTDVERNNDEGTAKNVYVRGKISGTDEYVSDSSTITISPRTVTLVAKTATKNYDGTAFTVEKNDYSIKEANDSYDFVQVEGKEKEGLEEVITKTIKADTQRETSQVFKGSCVTRIDLESIKYKANTKSSNYIIKAEDGKLTIDTSKKRTLTFTAHSKSKIYDGTPLVDSGYDVDYGEGLYPGDTVEVTVTGSVTHVNENSKNNNTISVIVRHNGTKIEYYNIVINPGTLEIKPRTVTLVAKSETRSYNGKELTAAENEYSIAEGEGTYDFVQTEGKEKEGLSSVLTKQYKVNNGTEELITKPLVYKGTRITRIDVDSIAYKTNTDKDDYLIKTVDGSIKIEEAKNKKKLEFTAESSEKSYDGKALSNSNYRADSNNAALWEGDELVVNVTGSVTHVSENSSANNVISVKVMHGNADVSNYYDIKTNNGTLKINPAKVVIKPNSNEKPYDGTSLTWKEIDGKKYSLEGNFATGEGFESVTLFGQQTIPGTFELKSEESKTSNVVYTLKSNTKSSDYDISVADASLTVAGKGAISIKVVANSDSKIYDSTALTNNGFKVYYKNADDSYESEGLSSSGGSVTLKNGDILTASVTGTITDFVSDGVDNSLCEVESMTITHAGADVKEAYAIVPEAGKLSITPKEVKVKAADREYTYDGTSHEDTENGFVVEAGSFYGTDGIQSVITEGSIRNVGEADNTISSHILKDGTKAENYNIVYEAGKLSVTAANKAISVNVPRAEKVYDGTPLTADFVKDENGTINSNVTGGLFSDDYVKVDSVASGSITNTWDSVEGNNSIDKTSVKVFHMDGTAETDVTQNYVITVNAGDLVVKPRPVTLTSADETKPYDGTVLIGDATKVTSPTYSADEKKGFIEGQGVTATMTGQALDVTGAEGISNTFDVEANEGTDLRNYSIALVPGTLTITPYATTVAISTEGDTKEYDGEPLTRNRYSSETELASGDELQVTFTGTQTDAGESDNTISYKVIANRKDKDGNNQEVDVTRNYTFAEPVLGKLKVEKRAIEVRSGDIEEEYDGTVHRANDVYISSGSFVDGQGGSYVLKGGQKNVGSSKNEFEVKFNETTNPDNYAVSTKFGDIRVTQRAVKLIVSDTEVDYDGRAHGITQYSVDEDTPLVQGDRIETIAFDNEFTEVGRHEVNIVKRAIKIVRDVTETPSAEINGTLETNVIRSIIDRIGDVTSTALMPYIVNAGTQTTEDVTGCYAIATKSGRLTINAPAVATPPVVTEAPAPAAVPVPSTNTPVVAAPAPEAPAVVAPAEAPVVVAPANAPASAPAVVDEEDADNGDNGDEEDADEGYTGGGEGGGDDYVFIPYSPDYTPVPAVLSPTGVLGVRREPAEMNTVATAASGVLGARRTPAEMTKASGVLGARREITGSGVLGKRRGPNTGDDSNVAVWIILMAVGFSGLGFSMTYFKKRKKNGEAA